MEFGCRYIYVDDQILQHTEGSRSPRISLPNGPIHDVAHPDSDVYDNVGSEGISQPSSSTDGFSDTHTETAFKTGQLSPTGTGPGLPGAAPASEKSLSVVSAYPKVEKSPPPVPSRDTKPRLVPAPDPQGSPIQSSFGNSEYVEVLPATPEELESQRIPVCKKKSLLDLPPDVAPKLLANCNILLLNVGKLVDVPETPSSESPLLCSNCAAGLSALNNIQKNKYWTCVFCGSVNTIEEGKKYYNFAEDEVFLGKPGGQHGSAGEDMLIFCIDISGSMSVTSEMQSESSPDDNNLVLHTSRMEVVKFGLMQSLNFLYVHNAKKRVALVTFSDQVKLYGDGTRNPQILEDTELLDPDYLKSQGESQPLPNPIDETIVSLRSKIECLKEKGATALGPAALVSIAMASQRPGSKASDNLHRWQSQH
ncbi:uncharacterized protein LOC128470129 [Spea bombifrons]|uniref:uncharacterized protein LOC128470129 n=1 Tax=Spea bombifrons TaxID=233779 RepID=UPI0023496DE2|nr:uncharacterized protein LOC128470129 [Spea bombifrons]